MSIIVSNLTFSQYIFWFIFPNLFLHLCSSKLCFPHYNLKQSKKTSCGVHEMRRRRRHLSLQACVPKRIAITILESPLMTFEIPKEHVEIARILQVGKSCWDFLQNGLCKITIAILTLSPSSVLGWCRRHLELPRWSTSWTWVHCEEVLSG